MMRKSTSFVATILMLLAACNKESADGSPMEGMTAEEHAMHMGGGGGAMDSTGAAVRNPVHMTAEQQRALGIVYATVQRSALSRTIRTVGNIEAAEPNEAAVTLKIDGFVEELLVASTGEAVSEGQPLLRLYSPKLVAAQEELLTALRLAARIDSSAGETWENATEMLAAARRRLAYWDITPEQIERVEQTGEITKTLTLVSPVTGIVLEKNVVEGQHVTAGMQLYRLADLREVWIEGEVFEQDLQHVREGSTAHIEVAAYPGVHVMGRVSFVYPTVDPATRTNRIRVTVPNRDLRLKPGMFTTFYIDAVIGAEELVLPTEAILATGERDLVFVREPDGMLYSREVLLGSRAGDLVQVLGGVSEGETVVASANFMVDAESRLASAGMSMAGMDHGVPDSTAAQSSPTMEHHHD
jgi:Cu(I)/Ag(I) efflux system membrane fusion protein